MDAQVHLDLEERAQTREKPLNGNPRFLMAVGENETEEERCERYSKEYATTFKEPSGEPKVPFLTE